MLIPLRLDGIIKVHYALVFLPLWICEFIIFLGATIASVSYILSPPLPTEGSLRSDFYGMIMCTGEHGLLALFEVLCCYKLQSNAKVDELPWLLIFAPIFALSLLSVVVAVWAIRNNKSFELELFFSINIVQFVFVAFKLDGIIDWHWTIVFIPLWVVLSLSVVGVLYAFVLAVLLARSVHMLASQRRHHLYSAVSHTLFVIPVLIFLLLLTGKLDAVSWSDDESPSQITFVVICAPLNLALFCLVLMSFGARGGNPWWFAMRASFCTFLLEVCPCLKQYANVSYKFRASSERQDTTEDFEKQSLQSDRSTKFPSRPVVPIHCSPLASYYELKQAYFRKLRTNHPDRGGSGSSLFLVTRAWSTLNVHFRDSTARRDYNIWLREQNLRRSKGVIGEQVVIYNVDRIEKFCRCCGGAFILEKADIDHIVDSAYFECPNCSLCLELLFDTMTLFISSVACDHIKCPKHDTLPSSTVGCAVSVVAHQYRAGTAEEQTELIELWDIGGSTVHQAASSIFLEGATGAILVHDLSNKKSEHNLSQWLALLRGETSIPSMISPFTLAPDSRSLLIDIESTPTPILVVGCKSDLAPERAKQTTYDHILINCRRPMLPGSTNRVILSKFFDLVVERKKACAIREKRRKVLPPFTSGFAKQLIREVWLLTVSEGCRKDDGLCVVHCVAGSLCVSRIEETSECRNRQLFFSIFGCKGGEVPDADKRRPGA
ncbi:unnamed protein product [Thelazia callipaeda]|uniref:DPH-type MB domain-containing protein n=1 Tax=Thelazia callipaeda TaxID=103827 RepID=A0A0N5CJE2_THECL|nr:unnamed protein product [Thelazia callipaeda]